MIDMVRRHVEPCRKSIGVALSLPVVAASLLGGIEHGLQIELLRRLLALLDRVLELLSHLKIA